MSGILVKAEDPLFAACCGDNEARRAIAVRLAAWLNPLTQTFDSYRTASTDTPRGTRQQSACFRDCIRCAVRCCTFFREEYSEVLKAVVSDALQREHRRGLKVPSGHPHESPLSGEQFAEQWRVVENAVRNGTTDVVSQSLIGDMLEEIRKYMRVSPLPVSTVVLARAGDSEARLRLADELLFCAIGVSAGLNQKADVGVLYPGLSQCPPERIAAHLIEGLQQYDPLVGRLDETLRTHLKRAIPRHVARIAGGITRLWDERDRYLPASDASMPDVRTWRAAMRLRHPSVHAALVAAVKEQFQEQHIEFPSELVREAQRGNSNALDALASQMYRQLAGFREAKSYSLGTEAQDLVQTIIVQVRDVLPTVRNPAAFAGFLRTTARNEFNDLLRLTRRRNEVAFDIAATAESGERRGDNRFEAHEPDAAEQLQMVEERADAEAKRVNLVQSISDLRAAMLSAHRKTMRRLAERDRSDSRKRRRSVVFEAWLKEDMNQVEIATSSGIDQATGMRWLDEGLQAFRAALLEVGRPALLDEVSACGGRPGSFHRQDAHESSDFRCVCVWLQQDSPPETLAMLAGASSTRAFKNAIRKQLRVWLGWANMEIKS